MTGPLRRQTVFITLATVAVVILVFASSWAANELRCRSQMTTGPNFPGSDCGYHLTRAPEEFRYAIDEGSQRLLYLSGGTAEAPDQIRLVWDGSVVEMRPTLVLKPDRNVDVCRNQPPRDARWWSAAINDDIANAIRTSDPRARLEGSVAGQWTPLRLHDSGCLWHGHA
jgi:hypothetical protein